MADSTVQETLLDKLPAELLDKINAGPGDIYEKVHQRELLLIEQIRHFAQIRVEELASFGRNLLEQRSYEQTMRERRESLPDIRPALKSIVKREPSTMEKRVSFSELPPEVEEFSSTEDDHEPRDHDARESDRDPDARYNFKTIDTSSDDDLSPLANGNGVHHDVSGYLMGSPPRRESEPPNYVPSSTGSAPVAGPAPGAVPDRWTTTVTALPDSTDDLTISFDDAYGEHREAEEPEIPESEESVPPSPQTTLHPDGFVGSAPISIGVESLMRKHKPSSESPPVGKTPDLIGESVSMRFERERQ